MRKNINFQTNRCPRVLIWVNMVSILFPQHRFGHNLASSHFMHMQGIEPGQLNKIYYMKIFQDPIEKIGTPWGGGVLWGTLEEWSHSHQSGTGYDNYSWVPLLCEWSIHIYMDTKTKLLKNSGLNKPYIEQAIHFLPLNPSQQLNLQNSTNANNRFWKLEVLQAPLLFRGFDELGFLLRIRSYNDK